MNIRNVKFNVHGTIDCEFEHDVFGWIPFTATPDDPEQHGRDIHAAIIERGEIAEYIEPIKTQEEKAAECRADRNERLKNLDAVLSNPLRWDEFSDAKKAEHAAYRQSLLDVPQQPGFPDSIEWPVMPES